MYTVTIHLIGDKGVLVFTFNNLPLISYVGVPPNEQEEVYQVNDNYTTVIVPSSWVKAIAIEKGAIT